MKILVTGAAGFIGSHTAERLAGLGHEVIGIDNFSPYYDIKLKQLNAAAIERKGVTIKTLDLRTAPLDTLLSLNFDFVFHFAAHPGISATSTFKDYLENNVMATQRLLTAIENCNNKPFFVNIATSSIYGLQATLAENAAPRPASWYGATKLAAEQLVLAYCRRGLLHGTSFRLYSVYGPRERPDKLYTRLIGCGLNNTPFPLYRGSEKHVRSFTYVGDIVDGIVSAINNKTACNGEIFNLGTEVEKTTATGIATVEELLKKTIAIKKTPPRSGDQSRTSANIDKARKLLGYSPRTTLAAGLSAQIAWYKTTFVP
ncbi:MAG: NAD-dependent epimerase/dehydratase family protein [Marinirhabdus sp.]